MLEYFFTAQEVILTVALASNVSDEYLIFATAITSAVSKSNGSAVFLCRKIFDADALKTSV